MPVTGKSFHRLVRLFMERTFHGGDESGAEDLDVSLGLVLSLLALPGGFYVLFLLDKYSTLLLWMRGHHSLDPLAATLPDEYFFIVLSMVVTGAVAIWRWDSILPDRRDYANLVPLPIPTRIILLGNLSAILILAAILALDVNAVSSVLFPLVVSASENTFRYFIHFAGIHALVVILASLFSFFTVFAIIGILMVTLPYSLFRRISLYTRAIMMVFLVGVLCTSFVVPSSLGDLPRSPVRFLSSVWFLGLAQLLHGQTDSPLSILGWLGLKALAGVVVVAMLAYLVSYKRCFVRIPEATDTSRSVTRQSGSWIFPAMDWTMLRTPFQRAGYRFVFITLMRSERHLLMLGGFLGLGFMIAAQVLFAAFNGSTAEFVGQPSAELLSVPLIVIFCAMVGLRFVFEIPAELRANWIFQLSLDEATPECLPMARRVMLSFGVPWVVAIAIPVYGLVWGWKIAALHAVVVLLWSALLAQVLLLRFRKIPFTCSYPPFRHSAIVIVLSYVLGFFVFVVFVSNVEQHGLASPAIMAILILFVPGVWLVLGHLQKEVPEVDRRLIFEEHTPAAFELLDLEPRS